VQELVIDGHAFAIAFAGFARPLRARIESPGEDGIEVALLPWPCARHLDSLRRHLYLDGERLALDVAGYAGDVLEWAEVPAPLHARLRPLALWWALGLGPDAGADGAGVGAGRVSAGAGEAVEPAAVPDAEGWVALAAGLRAQLRPWTWGERLAAQRTQVQGTPDGLDFDAVSYLERMLAACVQRVRTATGEAMAVEALDAEATRRLLAAVTAMNHPDREAMAPLADLPAALAAATLRLCAAMGWTPGRVLAMPAAEVEALLALLDAAEGHGADGAGSRFAGRFAPAPRARPQRPAGPPPRPRIADHPDAIVILFDEDEGEP
jgi:hypothetical protein